MSPCVCLVVGDNCTEHCGVKDYAHRLAEELNTIGVEAEVMAPSDWSLKSLKRFCENLRERHADIVHVQYPSIGNRKSLCPHMLGLIRGPKGVAVTLHEYSSMPLLQKASAHLFRVTARVVLFTAEAELRNYGFPRPTYSVIPIGSNVPVYPEKVTRGPSVVYFGQIRPNKGIEDFLQLARLSLHAGQCFKFQILGSVPRRRAAYYQALRASAPSGVEWLPDQPPEQISRIMASSLAAYLPYPDGASYRRGSLLAALSNGVPTLTTIGPATPNEMKNVFLPTTNPAEALMHIRRLYDSPNEAAVLSRIGKSFAERFSWAEIARQHETVYHQMLSLPLHVHEQVKRQRA